MMAFELVEPWADGPEAADYRAGLVAATIANCHRDPASKPEPFCAADFFPPRRAAEARHVRGADLSPDELSALLDAELFGISPTRH